MTYKISILQLNSYIERQLTVGWFKCETTTLDLDELIKDIMYYLNIKNLKTKKNLDLVIDELKKSALIGQGFLLAKTGACFPSDKISWTYSETTKGLKQ